MKNKITKLSFVVLMMTGIAYGQNQPMSEKVRQATNVEFLQQFAKEKTTEFERNYNKAVEIARSQGKPISGEYEDGSSFGLVRYDEETGSLVYYKTYNGVVSERNTFFNNVPTGSSLQTANAKPLHTAGIDGAGMIVGVWDGGAASSTQNHQGFLTGRFKPKSNVLNHPLASNNGRAHMAHVAGTVAAGYFGSSGIAMGFAYGATVHAYPMWGDEGPMAAAAANQQEPIYVSNHSYGLDFGGSGIGVGIFGRYDASAREYDIIANNAPYYTIVFAAGNDRGKGYNPSRSGGKDLLSQAGVSKNTVVVAATRGTENFSGITGPSSVTGSSPFIASYSSYGPTDDFRIKPDIAAKGGEGIAGEQVTSVGTQGSASTAEMQGTSMAAPAVTGVITLWQSYYKDVFDEYMRSASVRALMAHTAREAGPSPGPDFMFGWGLIDADKGKQIIDASEEGTALFKELTLSQGVTAEYVFEYDGLQPLIATIAWNDPAGTATSATNNPSPKLINDLDVRLINQDTDQEYYPWALPSNVMNMSPSNAQIAIRSGDNFRDNIEKIEPGNAVAGNYKVVVTHKGNLQGGSQDFSLIVSGAGDEMPQEVLLSIEEHALNSLNLYPNPVMDVLYVSGDLDVLENSSVVIYDVNGKKIIETVLKQEMGIDVSVLTEGMYILSISKNGVKQNYKFIKK